MVHPRSIVHRVCTLSQMYVAKKVGSDNPKLAAGVLRPWMAVAPPPAPPQPVAAAPAAHTAPSEMEVEGRVSPGPRAVSRSPEPAVAAHRGPDATASGRGQQSPVRDSIMTISVPWEAVWHVRPGAVVDKAEPLRDASHRHWICGPQLTPLIAMLRHPPPAIADAHHVWCLVGLRQATYSGRPPTVCLMPVFVIRSCNGGAQSTIKSRVFFPLPHSSPVMLPGCQVHFAARIHQHQPFSQAPAANAWQLRAQPSNHSSSQERRSIPPTRTSAVVEERTAGVQPVPSGYGTSNRGGGRTRSRSDDRARSRRRTVSPSPSINSRVVDDTASGRAQGDHATAMTAHQLIATISDPSKLRWLGRLCFLLAESR